MTVKVERVYPVHQFVTLIRLKNVETSTVHSPGDFLHRTPSHRIRHRRDEPLVAESLHQERHGVSLRDHHTGLETGNTKTHTWMGVSLDPLVNNRHRRYVLVLLASKRNNNYYNEVHTQLSFLLQSIIQFEMY